MKIDETRFSKRKVDILKRSIDKDDKEMGDLSDLEHGLWGPDELEIIGLSRGINERYGDIEDILPKYPTWFILLKHFNLLNIISLSRGNDPMFGSIEDLIKKRKYRNDLNFLLLVSLSRGTSDILNSENIVEYYEKYKDRII